MNIEVYKYEKEKGTYTFYLAIPDLNVKTHMVFDRQELLMCPGIHQLKALFESRIKDAIYWMLEYIQEKKITEFIADHIDREDIFLKMLVVMMEPKLGKIE